jgi:large repetitive protein
MTNGVCVLPDTFVGDASGYFWVIMANNNEASDTFTVVSGSLPPGLTMPSHYGVADTIITGQATQLGTFTFVVKAADPDERLSVLQTYSITVKPQPPDRLVCSPGDNGGTLVNGVCVLPAAALGQGYEGFIITSNNSGGTFSIISGSLPPGLFMPASYGASGTIVAGTPTKQGTFTFTVKGTDQQGQPLQQTYSIKVGPPLPLVVSPCCPDGTVGVAYAQNFFVQGGVAPYAWSIVSGQLPPGLRLVSPNPPDVDNRLSGTPTTAGTFTFTVQVTDSRGAQTTVQDSLTVHPLLVVATSHLPAGTVGVAYRQALIAQGGLAPYSWFLVSGQLPPGLFLDATPPDFNNLLSGTPTTAGTFTFTIQVWDALGDQASGSVTVIINR